MTDELTKRAEDVAEVYRQYGWTENREYQVIRDLLADRARMQALLRMIAHRARLFPTYPMGNHLPEVFDAIGEPRPDVAELEAQRGEPVACISSREMRDLRAGRGAFVRLASSARRKDDTDLYLAPPAPTYPERMALIRIRDAVHKWRAGLDSSDEAVSVIATVLAAAPSPEGGNG